MANPYSKLYLICRSPFSILLKPDHQSEIEADDQAIYQKVTKVKGQCFLWFRFSGQRDHYIFTFS